MRLIDPRKRYVRAMMSAIRKAAKTSDWWGGVDASKTNGLRVIKTFEKVNGIPFDPFDPAHIRLIEGNGHHEEFFRKMRMLFDEIQRR